MDGPPKAPKGWAAILTGKMSSATLTPSEAAALAAEEAAREKEAKKQADALREAAEAEAAKAREEQEQRAEEERLRRRAEAEAAAATEAAAAAKKQRAAAAAAVAATNAPARTHGGKAAAGSFAGWASVVSGKTPDPAKEGWHTLVSGKLDAESSPTATVTLGAQPNGGSEKSSKSSSDGNSIASEHIKMAGSGKAAATKASSVASSESGSSSSAERSQISRSASPAVGEAGSEPLRKAWTGWAVKGPPPKVDLKAEMAAAKVTRVTTPPPPPPAVEEADTGKKTKAAKGSDKEGKAAKAGKGGKGGANPAPPPHPAARGASFSPPPPPASPPPALPATARYPTRPFATPPAPPSAPNVDEAVAVKVKETDTGLSESQRAKLAARLGAEMLDIAHVRPDAPKGATLRAERRATDLLVRAINAIAQSLYPQASVEVFGSFPTASWTPGASNLDVALVLPDSASATPQAKMDALNSLAVALRSNGWVTDVNVVPSAFRPLIFMSTHSAFFQPLPSGGAAGATGENASFASTENASSSSAASEKASSSPGAAPPLPPGPPPPGATLGMGLGQGGVGLPLEVHISIKDRNHKGASTVKFLRQAEAEYPALTPVLSVQKAYLAVRGLRGVYKGGIGSYSLALLAIHALQHKAHEDLEAGRDSPKADANERDARTLGESVLHFLEFYGHGVDLTRAAIKVHPLKPTGKAAKKAVAAANANGGGDALPWGVFPTPENAPDGSPRAVGGGGVLQVEDPMQVGRNAGGGCFGVPGVQASFREQIAQLAAVPEDASLLQHLFASAAAAPGGVQGKVCVV